MNSCTVPLLAESKINGKLLLSSVSTLVETLELSLGFTMQIEEKVKQVAIQNKVV